jgi:hypothetical protein
MKITLFYFCIKQLYYCSSEKHGHSKLLILVPISEKIELGHPKLFGIQCNIYRLEYKSIIEDIIEIWMSYKNKMQVGEGVVGFL